MNFGLSGKTASDFSFTPIMPDAFSLSWSFTDGSRLIVTLRQPIDGNLKISLVVTAGTRLAYTVTLVLSEIDRLVLSNPIFDTVAKTFSFSYAGIPFFFDWSDITDVNVLGATYDVTNQTVTLSLRTPRLSIGASFLFDPFVDGGGGGGDPNTPPVSMRYSGRRLFRDSFDKVFCVLGHGTGNMQFLYSNNPDEASPTFTSVDLGASFAVAGKSTAGTFKEAGAVADKMMVAWVNGTTAKFAQLTINRDGSNNITGVTAGSILSITTTKPPTDICLGFIPSIGEVAAVWTENSAAGGKGSRIQFARIVFGSPPTYKNLAGTASSLNLIENYTANHTKAFAAVAQNEFDNAIHVVWHHQHEKNFKTANGSLGGTFGAVSTLHVQSDDLTGTPTWRPAIMSGTSTSPQLVASGMFTTSPSFSGDSKVYGSTNGAALSLLGSEIQDVSELNTTETVSTTKALGTDRVGFAVRNGGGGLTLEYLKFNGTVWGASTVIDTAISPYSAIRSASLKPYESDLIEGLYGKRNVNTWEIFYFQISFVLPPEPPPTPEVLGPTGRALVEIKVRAETIVEVMIVPMHESETIVDFIYSIKH